MNRMQCKQLSTIQTNTCRNPATFPQLTSSAMAQFCFSLLLLISLCSLLANAEVYMVVVDDDPVVSYKSHQNHNLSVDEAQKYKEKVINRHDIFLDSILPTGSYTKLYSYTHLLNGFALHTTSEEAMEILNEARGVRLIQEDIKMKKMTTHTPNYIRLPAGVWPALGGAERSGEGVVIGIIDTGINPNHPSFAKLRPKMDAKLRRFRGKCESGDEFPSTACNGKIVGAQFFARGAMAAGDFNATSDHASPFDADGHGSHTASIAAGNHHIAVLSKNYNYGCASGMAPGARIAMYKAIYSFGGYMSDVVAAIDKAVEDGVDILSLSIGPSSVPSGLASFLNILEVELLLATKAGVLVVQAAGNGGPALSSVLSFGPWIVSVAASTTDRKYNNSIILGNGHILSGTGLSPSTTGDMFFTLAAAEDVCTKDRGFAIVQNCQHPDFFIPKLVQGKLIICSYITNFLYAPTSMDAIVGTIQKIGAAGFIITVDDSLELKPPADATLTLSFPGIILNNIQTSQVLWDYYNSRTRRATNGDVVNYGATGRILDGRHATYTGKGPVVASYSSRGPDVNNAFMETADVLKPNILAPGSSIWAAWSPKSQSNQYAKGQDFALLSGTSMATPHIAGVAALIKHKHPLWSPAAIASAMTTTADVTDSSGSPILAQGEQLGAATALDYGAGFVNPTKAIDPGLVFDVEFENYVQFLCAVPGVDDESVLRAVGTGCPTATMDWCSDLNAPSVTVANLVGSRQVLRKVTSVGSGRETYRAVVHEPSGIAVTVRPRKFTISRNETRRLRIMVEAREATNAYTFGDVVLNGDRKHVVRIPLAIFVSSTLKS